VADVIGRLIVETGIASEINSLHRWTERGRGRTPGENLNIKQLIDWRIDDLAAVKAAGTP
jgi:hypothetical protein